MEGAFLARLIALEVDSESVCACHFVHEIVIESEALCLESGTTVVR